MFNTFKKMLNKGNNRDMSQIDMFNQPSTCNKNRYYNERSDSILRNCSIIEEFKEYNNFEQKYNIIKTIYEKPMRGTYIVESSGDNKKYFVKMRSKSLQCENEVKIFKKLLNHNNKNVIGLVEYEETQDYYYFIYEFFSAVSLNKFIELNKRLEKEDIKNIFLQIVSGIKFLHSLDIIHCDIKLDNILIDINHNVKIIDFDISIICEDNEYLSDDAFGTMQYIAPESYDLHIYSKKSDVWELGVVLYILITGKFPYDYNCATSSKRNMYRRNEFKHITFENIKDKKMRHLVKSMLTFVDSDRIDIEDILKYKW